MSTTEAVALLLKELIVIGDKRATERRLIHALTNLGNEEWCKNLDERWGAGTAERFRKRVLNAVAGAGDGGDDDDNLHDGVK